MRNAGLKTLLFIAATLVSITASAAEQKSFTDLVAKGFEVRSVVLVPLEVAKRASENVTTDTVLVTLQHKKSVAVCYIALANWAYMNKASLDTPTLCEVR
jgi:hypothetical protein